MRSTGESFSLLPNDGVDGESCSGAAEAGARPAGADCCLGSVLGGRETASLVARLLSSRDDGLRINAGALDLNLKVRYSLIVSNSRIKWFA